MGKPKTYAGLVIGYGRGKNHVRIYVENGKLYFPSKALGRLLVLVSGVPMTQVEDENDVFVCEDYLEQVNPELLKDLPEIRAKVLKNEAEFKEGKR